MAGGSLCAIIVNALVFSLIFWILTFIAKYLYTNRYSNYKLNFYECGFKNLTTYSAQYSINYLMLVLFLLIYDGEFLVLIPFALNIGLSNYIIILAICFFISWLVLSLLIDYAYGALEWQVMCLV